ncbi:TetR/AcrR family transcriptional regulator [Parabacteroides distasonis]|uniref:TetR/AcrR family transcriptional regulator n=1 Tax=Parabacteroides distasonis TaxID=823 RepID=UPI003F745316
MAKAFDDNERKLIKSKLKEGALLFIQQQGVRKTSVDELVKYANISKGAFYLFYVSKELLFFDTIIDYHNKLEKEFLNAINKHTDNITVDILTDIISDLLINNKQYFISIFANSDIEYLSRKLPQEVLSKHADDDTILMNKLLKFIPKNKPIDTKVFAGALRGAFLTILNERTIGVDIYNDVFKFIVRGIVKQLFND